MSERPPAAAWAGHGDGRPDHAVLAPLRRDDGAVLIGGAFTPDEYVPTLYAVSQGPNEPQAGR